MCYIDKDAQRGAKVDQKAGAQISVCKVAPGAFSIRAMAPASPRLLHRGHYGFPPQPWGDRTGKFRASLLPAGTACRDGRRYTCTLQCLQAQSEESIDVLAMSHLAMSHFCTATGHWSTRVQICDQLAVAIDKGALYKRASRRLIYQDSITTNN